MFALFCELALLYKFRAFVIIKKVIFPVKFIFRASLSVDTVQSRTVKRYESRTANPLVDVRVSYILTVDGVMFCKDTHRRVSLNCRK